MTNEEIYIHIHKKCANPKWLKMAVKDLFTVSKDSLQVML